MIIEKIAKKGRLWHITRLPRTCDLRQKEKPRCRHVWNTWEFLCFTRGRLDDSRLKMAMGLLSQNPGSTWSSGKTSESWRMLWSVGVWRKDCLAWTAAIWGPFGNWELETKHTTIKQSGGNKLQTSLKTHIKCDQKRKLIAFSLLNSTLQSKELFEALQSPDISWHCSHFFFPHGSSKQWQDCLSSTELHWSGAEHDSDSAEKQSSLNQRRFFFDKSFFPTWPSNKKETPSWYQLNWHSGLAQQARSSEQNGQFLYLNKPQSETWRYWSMWLLRIHICSA